MPCLAREPFISALAYIQPGTTEETPRHTQQKGWRLTNDHENEPRDQGNQPTIESRRLHNGQSCVSVQRAR
jgi:hypothetical protein